MEKFLKFLYHEFLDSDSNLFFGVAFKGKKIFSTHFFKCTDIDIRKALHLISLKKDNFNVYVTLNSFSNPTRTKENVSSSVYNIFLDFDNYNAFTKFLQSEKKEYLTIIQTSDKKFQVILKLKNPLTVTEAETITKCLAKKYGSDIAATDATRVIRTPNTYNHKYNPPFATKIIQYATEYYTPPTIEPEPEKLEPEVKPDLKIDNLSKHQFNSNQIKWFKKLYLEITQTAPLKNNMAEPDYSIADARFIKKLLYYGYPPDMIVEALLIVSPKIQVRKPKPEQYVSYTVNKIYNYLTQKQQGRG